MKVFIEALTFEHLIRLLILFHILNCCERFFIHKVFIKSINFLTFFKVLQKLIDIFLLTL